MIPENLKRIGVLSRPHGFDGTMLLRFSDNFEDELKEREFLFLSFDKTMIPFLIEDLRFAGETAYVRLSEAITEKQTEFLRGKEVYISSGSSNQNSNIESFTGYIFRDVTSGKEGQIHDYFENGENPLFLTFSDGNEFLLPANPALFISVDTKHKILKMKLPEGLFELGD